MAASVVDSAGFGGHPGAGQSNYTTAWSLTAGNLIYVAEMTRSRSGAPTITNCSDETDVAQTTADTNSTTAHLFIGTVDANGTVTYTPSQTGADRWTVVIVEIADGTYLDAAGVHEGPFDSAISLASDAMTGDGGVVVFSSQSNADGAIDLTAPTVLFENAPSGFMLSQAAAWAALDDTQTSTMTGSIPGGGVNVHHDFWALFGAAGGGGAPGPAPVLRIVQSGLRLG